MACRAGVLDAIREQRTDVQGGSILHAVAKRVATLDDETFGGRAGHDAEILRGDLNRIPYDLGVDADGGRQTADGIEVGLDSGPRRLFDRVDAYVLAGELAAAGGDHTNGSRRRTRSSAPRTSSTW